MLRDMSQAIFVYVWINSGEDLEWTLPGLLEQEDRLLGHVRTHGYQKHVEHVVCYDSTSGNFHSLKLRQ